MIIKRNKEGIFSIYTDDEKHRFGFGFSDGMLDKIRNENITDKESSLRMTIEQQMPLNQLSEKEFDYLISSLLESNYFE